MKPASNKSIAPKTSEMTQNISVAQVKLDSSRKILANLQQCQTLASRFNLERIDQFECIFHFKAIQGGQVKVKGHLKARFPQYCVISGEPIEQILDNYFEIDFLPAEKAQDENFSMTHEDSEETEFFYYEGDFLPLGEAAAEQFALEMPAYPRSKHLQSAQKQEEPLQQGGRNKSQSPFKVLEKLSFKNK